MTEVNETKEKILEAAETLFAEKGFDGASVREIAKRADVNLAAINYHFQNKQNLYLEVYKRNHAWMESEVNKLGQEEGIDSKEFSWNLYQLFVTHSSKLMNTYKLILTNSVDFSGLSQEAQEIQFSPPGEETFLKIITKDVGEDIPMEGRHWAVRMIFSDLIHFGVFMGTSLMREKCKHIKYFSPEEKKKSIYALVEAILSYLKVNGRNWEN